MMKLEDNMDAETVAGHCEYDKSIRREKRRRTLFAEQESNVVGFVRALSEITDQERSNTWWTPVECAKIRYDAKLLTKDFRKRDHDMVSSIDDAFAQALHLACTLKEKELEDVMVNPSAHSQCLNRWCSRSVSGRGLERYTSPKHRYERTEFAAETRNTVLRLASDDSVTTEQLSVFYSEYSRCAAIYARLCGDADAAAAREQPEMVFPMKHRSSRRDLLLKSKQLSRGNLLARQLSSRRIDTAV